MVRPTPDSTVRRPRRTASPPASSSTGTARNLHVCGATAVRRRVRRRMREPDGSMPLTLVTGPANAEKAGHVLAAYRAALDRGPLLVVPTAADVERYRRELSAEGAVFGVQVMRFGRLEREIAWRSEVRGRPLGPLARERVAAAAVGAARLDRLAASAATPGFLPAFLGLVDELGGPRTPPGRLVG